GRRRAPWPPTFGPAPPPAHERERGPARRPWCGRHPEGPRTPPDGRRVESAGAAALREPRAPTTPPAPGSGWRVRGRFREPTGRPAIPAVWPAPPPARESSGEPGRSGTPRGATAAAKNPARHDAGR